METVPDEPETPAEPSEPVEEKVDMTKAEADALRREVAESRRKAKKAEDEAKRTAEEQAKKDGEWQKLAEQKGKEAEEAAARLGRLERQRTATEVATRLKFHNPAGAHRFLGEDPQDEQQIEAALREIADRESYLVAPATSTTGRDVEQVLKNGRPVDPTKTPPPDGDVEPGLGRLRQAYEESGAT